MGFSARLIVKGFVCLTALSAVMGYTLKKAEAGHGVWNTQVCEITGTDSSDLTDAAHLYNKRSNRGCTRLISFIDSGTMNLSSRLTITGVPVRPGSDGLTYGTIISNPSGVAITLDASRLGDCPITVRSGSKVDLMRITFKVNNVNNAVCDESGNALYDHLGVGGHVTSQTATQMDAAYIHSDVTIIRADGEPIERVAEGFHARALAGFQHAGLPPRRSRQA